jgi:hypothetical protein
VTEKQWRALLSKLRQAATSCAEIQSEARLGWIGCVPGQSPGRDTAYHLGAIRQILAVANR